MGTRGAYGYRIDQTDKVMYNHFDSYPECLGDDMVEFAREIAKDIPRYRELAKALEPVNDETPITPEHVKRAQELNIVNLNVGRQSLDDWYCLLRGAQGHPKLTLKMGCFKDSRGFLHDSLFCEYAYLINFDTEEIEFYEGANKDRTADGRYAQYQEKEDSDYCGVRLKGTAPLTNIPDDWMALFYPPEPEED